MIITPTAVLLLSVLMTIHSVVGALRVVRMQTSKFKHNRLNKRDYHSVVLVNAVSEGLYYVNASVGTPNQSIALQIDTGSSDVWMFGPGSCDLRTSHCFGGDFDPSQSSSLTELGSGFSIRYFTAGSGVVGNYIADNFGVGETTVNNLTMAVATSARNINTGIMGIGFDTDESLSAGARQYPNIVDKMVAQGLINTRAYSLWLDDLGAGAGTILFGGYDTGKYTGDLGVLDLQPDAISGKVNTMTVAWTSLSITNSEGSTILTPANFSSPAVLDSGTTYTALPTSIFNQVANYFGVVNDQNYGYLVRCNVSNYEGTLDYGFGGSRGPLISVKYSELAIPTYNKDGTQLTFSDSSYACVFGMFPVADGEEILFGDTFLRSAYVVYDLENKQLALAPTNFESTTSNIVEVLKGSVMRATRVISNVNLTQVGT